MLMLVGRKGQGIGNGNFDVQPEAITHFVKNRTHNPFRRRILAAYARHVPASPAFCETVFAFHGSILMQGWNFPTVYL